MGRTIHIITMNELFIPVDGYPNYFVSNIGRVRSFKNNKSRILKTWTDKRGYKLVSLCQNGRKKNKRIHQLVAQAFLGHVPDKTLRIVVDHIDNDITNNDVTNLQLITQRENTTKDRKNKTGYSSVCQDSKNSFSYRIRINGKKYVRCGFKTAKEAFLARQQCLQSVE